MDGPQPITSGDLSQRTANPWKTLQWRLECLGHSIIEGLAALLPGPLVFRLGEALGVLAWHILPGRRLTVLRNLRIACAGELDHPEIHQLARATFRRTGANLISAAHTARLGPEQVRRVITVENMRLLEDVQARGKGVVLLLAHMGNWELLTKLIHVFPPGSKCGAFYRPLNNPLLDARVLRRRQADGTRMFSKRDPFHEVTKFLREGGIVGILSDQRAGMQGEVCPFFGRLTRATPLPGLLARRAKAEVLALSLVTTSPGKWKAVFHPVDSPPTTAHCMAALETAMKTQLADVFWLQERWKVFAGPHLSFHRWLDGKSIIGAKRHRALIWLAGAPADWQPPDSWRHPDLTCDVAVTPDFVSTGWPDDNTRFFVPVISQDPSAGELRRHLRVCEWDQPLPIDFILAPAPSAALRRAAGQLCIPVIHLP